MNHQDDRFEPMDDRFLPVSHDRITELESRLGVTLPSGYVAFLSRYGHCGFAGDAFVTTIDGVELPIFTFFGDPKLFAKLLTYDDLAAERKFAIAADMAANPYVLDGVSGWLYFIDFTVNPPVGTRVAESFDSFLAAIKVDPEP